MTPTPDPMLRRPQFASLVSLVLLSFVAATGVPRDTWYAHRHAGDGHGHEHGWDGARVGRTSTSILDLITDRGHEHDHPGARHVHDGEHRHDRAHDRAHDGEHRHDRAHGHLHDAEPAGRTASTRPAATVRPHAGNDGQALASPGDPAHAHWQAPFQTAAATNIDLIAATDRRTLHRSAPPLAAPVERARALRARSPPVSPV